eukprot:2010035-Amphidinium_carterae.1
MGNHQIIVDFRKRSNFGGREVCGEACKSVCSIPVAPNPGVKYVVTASDDGAVALSARSCSTLALRATRTSQAL